MLRTIAILALFLTATAIGGIRRKRPPEPSAVVLLLIGGGGLFAMRKKIF